MNKPVTPRITKYWRGKLSDWFKGAELVTVRRHVSNFERGLGDVKPLKGTTIKELRVHQPPGFRVYWVPIDGAALILHGGPKATQDRDIAKAKLELSAYIEETKKSSKRKKPKVKRVKRIKRGRR